jgi:RNA polymerase sigma-70 factor, ECF subfamily
MEKEMTTAAIETTAPQNGISAGQGVFERFILPHRRALFAQAHRLTGNAADAEDLVQETLVRAYTRRDQLTGGETAAAWLYTMQRNLFINDYRKKTKGPAFSELTEESARHAHLPRSVTTESPETTVARQMENQALMKAIARLPAMYRDVLILSDLEGLSYQEIAERTGQPIGTIRSRLARARQRIQRSLYSWRSAAAAGAYRAT